MELKPQPLVKPDPQSPLLDFTHEVPVSKRDPGKLTACFYTRYKNHLGENLRSSRQSGYNQANRRFTAIGSILGDEMGNSDLGDVFLLDATGQADLVRKGEVASIELVEAAITRMERLNPALNAVVTPMYDLAREAASGPVPEGPFTGVPFLLKDFLAECAGVRFTEGSAFLKDFVPEEDSELVKRFKRAGLIIVGKTNTPEFAIGTSTEPRLFGPTRNPWNTDRTAGGSSGGSAAAVASGMVPMAHGNDAGGSIRIPASCCGVFGLKPTRARNPLGPHYGDLFSGLIVEHALTRSVRDSAALLDATRGPDLGDPNVAPPPARPFLQEVGAEPGRLRVAFTAKTPLGTALHPDCEVAVRDAAALCEGLGHEVEEAAPTYDAETLWKGVTTVLSVGTAWALEDWSRRTGRKLAAEDFEAFIWAFAKKGRGGQRAGIPSGRPGPATDHARHRALFRGLRRLPHADLGSAACPPGDVHHAERRFGGRGHRSPPPGGDVLSLHVRLQRHRPAGDVRTPELERRGIARGDPLHRALRRRGDAVPPGRPARGRPAVE